MGKTITRPAALVRQNDLRLYATSLKVADLLIPNFYDIERLDPERPDSPGYQRLLNKARAKKLADYLVSGQSNADAFLPTSIFLATDKDVVFEPETNSITIDISSVGPFGVVDGQHRIEGLKMASERNRALLDFEVPVNIAVNLPKLDQMCHFLIVNTTQKSVDHAVEQRIFARITESLSFQDVPSLPRWIRRIVESEDDKRALSIVDYLNETDTSPWHNRVLMANQTNKNAYVNQGTFVKAVKKYVLAANNPISERPSDEQQKICLNYWKALASILDVGRPTVLYKYNGVELFSKLSSQFFYSLQNRSDFKVSTMQGLLSATFENLEGDYAGVGHPDWWVSGTGAASSLNSAAINKVHQELARALAKSQSRSDIQL